jgi:hypothetical protein
MMFLLCSFAWVGAQGLATEPIAAMRAADRILVDLTALSQRYGWSVSVFDGSITVRTGTGILTVFADSPDALWQRVGDEYPACHGAHTEGHVEWNRSHQIGQQGQPEQHRDGS